MLLSTNQAKMEGEFKESLFTSLHKPPIENGRPSSMVVKVHRIKPV